jgi:secreted trypsin-like serine protease
MRIRIAFAVALVAAILPAAPAGAIVGGTDDGAGHPNVGLHYFTEPDGTFRCSNTLIAPRLVLTAAHCTENDPTDVLVTFDNPAQRRPALGGDATRFISGTAHASPLWTGKLQNTKLNDIGVIVLDRRADSVWPGITPVKLASQGLLDRLGASGGLKKTPFTLVGYGVFFEKPADGAQKREAVSDRVRRVTTVGIQNITSDVIKFLENEKNATFGGGSCFGDSGGPAFLGDVQVGVTSFGGAQFCTGMGGYQRTENAEAYAFIQEWLARYPN